jgi:uncharacterized repeat protein (TIGR01451 family)
MKLSDQREAGFGPARAKTSLGRLCGALRRLATASLLTLLATNGFAEGSRTLYPATYPAAGFRGDLDLTNAANLYALVAARRQFLYVYANAGEYILLASSNRNTNVNADIFVYNPQAFGAKGNETIPATANFSCSGTAPALPAGSFGGAGTGNIAARVNELAGPNSADNSVTVTNGYAPCAYKAPTTGIYGVLFTAAATGGGAPTGSVGTLHIGNATVAAWEVAVRAAANSTTDINARVFTYAYIGYTGGNSRPLFHILYYATPDGSRYQEIMQGLDPNGYALWGNVSGFLDSGQPLYKDIRGTDNLDDMGLPAGVVPQLPQAPIFFSTIDPAGANAATATTLLQALGIPLATLTPQITAPNFNGLQGGNQTYVGGGGVFTFTAQNDTTYQIVISAGVDFDPGNPLNVTLNGLAPNGANSVLWSGLANNGIAFPTGTFSYQIVGRNGEIHFPISDSEGNLSGGPTVSKLNGFVGDATVFYDDRGYVTRNNIAVGTLNGLLCPANPPVPPTPNHSLTGQDSSAKTFSGPNCNGGVGTCYYRYWPGVGNSNTDCAAAAGFGDAKALDLWTYQQTPVQTSTVVINPVPPGPTIATTVAVPPTTFPGATVNGSFDFQNVGGLSATGTTYGVVIGTPGNCPTAVAFSLLPAGVTFTGFNAATCVATFTGLPATLTAGTKLNFNFSYTAPASGSVPVTTTINSASSTPTSATATGTTVIIAADVTTTVSVPATAPTSSIVSGTITYSNSASATSSANGVTYTATIGTPGSCPGGVSFPVLPGGVTATYNSVSCQVTFSGMPTTLTAGQALTIGFQYTGPATAGTVPVSSAISTATPETSTANDTASGTTTFIAPNVTLAKAGPATALQGAAFSDTINLGNSAAVPTLSTLTVADKLPAGVVASSVTAGTDVAAVNCGALPSAAGATLICTITLTAPLAASSANGAASFTITVSSANAGSITNFASVDPTGGASPPTPGAACAPATSCGSATTTITPVADVAITKTDGVASVNAGATVNYTIVVSNAGPSAANNATFQDPAVANLSVTAVTCATPTGGAACPTVANTTVALMQGTGILVPTLPSGGSVTFTVTGTAGASGTIANTATIAAPTGTTDANLANNSATDTDTINPIANLAISKTDGVASVNAGSTVTYTIVVSNGGPSAANGAIFQDPAVANLSVTAVTCGTPSGGAACPTVANTTVALMQGAGIVIPTLPNGGSVTFTVSGTAGASGTIVNTATVAAPAGVTDPVLANNTATDTDTINPVADLAITKTDGTASVNAGSTVTYTIVVSNAGPSAANGAIFKDPAVANLTVTGVTCNTPTGGAACPAVANTTVALMQGAGIVIPTLPSGGSVTFTVTGTAGTSGSIVNTATVTAPAGVTDTNPGNNSATDTDTINPIANLAVSKVSSPVGSYLPGQSLNYTITVTNNGPSDVTGASVADTVPATVTVSSWTCAASGVGADCDTTAAGTGASGATNAIALNNVALPNGTSLTITVSGTVQLSATGSITNTVSASPPAGTGCTTAPCTKTASVTNTNGGTQQLSIMKTATPGAFAVGQGGTYSILVSNTGTTSTAGAITINDPLPGGITTTATPSGTGWDCSASTATNISCTTPAVLLPGGNAPVINAPITVAVSTVSPAVNTATAQGGGDATCPAAGHCQSTISTPVDAALINVTKSLSGTLVVGVPTSYVITATNNGQASTLAGTITDTIPAGLTIGTLPSGCSSLGGQNISCVLSAGIATGGSISYTIPVTPQASVDGTSVSNTATNNGGGDPSCPAAGHCSGTVTNTVTAPQLLLTKSATPTTFVVNQPATYTLTLTNNGTAATTAVTTITDTIPGGLTIGTLPGGCSAAGQTVTCTVAAPLATNAPVSFAIPVTPTNALNGLSVTNTAGATGGGDPGCPTGTPVGSLPARCVGSVTTSVNAPQLTMTKTASGTFSVGIGASYTLQVKNTGTAATTGTITITDVIPNSLTIGTLPAGCTATGQQVTCTSAASLAVNATISFTIPVTPTAAASPSVSNTATVQGGGDPTCPVTPNCTSTITTSVSAPQLQVTKTSNGPWTVNQAGATYVLTVKNAGTAATVGVVTADDALPNGITPQWAGTLTVGPWSCTFAGQAVTCIATPNLATSATSTITLPVNVTVAAVPAGSGPNASLTNNASVGGGGDPFDGGTTPLPGNTCTTLDPANPGHCASVTTTVNALADVAIVKSLPAPNPVVPGLALTWTITVTNNGPSEASAVTTSDTVPAAVTTLSLGGADAGSCSIAGQVVSCAFGVLANGATRTYTIGGTLAPSFTGSLTNTATVSTTTTDPNPGNNSSTSTVPSAPSADLSITKTDGTTTYTPGGTTTYTIVASNVGPSNAPGAMVTDAFPAALTATWTCVGAGGGTCTASGSGNINDTVNLPVGASVTYTVTATISSAAAGNLVNTATVTAPAGVTDTNPGNNSATDTDTINPIANLAVSKVSSPVGSYLPGQSLNYTITVTNNGPSDVTGASVADTVPATVTVSSWTCAASGVGADCDTTAAGTGASGATNAIALNNVALPNGTSLTITVSGTVQLSATGSITNTVSASPPAGTGCTTAPCTKTASVTNTNGGTQQLSIMKTATPGAFAVGQGGTYSILVSNTGTTSTAGAITINDPLPGGITTTATPSGTGWDCSASTATNISCTTPAVLLPGGNAPVINAPITVAVSTVSPAVNTATAQGGGDATCPAAGHCQSTISTPVDAALINVTKSLSGTLVVGVPTSYVITATNNGQASTLAGTITDTIPAGLTIGTLPSGCSSLGGQNISCVLSAGIATGGSISYTIPVTPQASVDGTSVSNTATNNGGGDPSCPAAGHCSGTVTNTVTAPQLLLTKSATPTTFVVNQPATYTLTLTNNGTAATTAVTTITDTIPGGLTIGTLPGGCSAAGQTVTCTVAAPLATNAPVSFAIPVTPTNALNGLSVTNTAGATGGGDPGCPTGTPVGSLPARCVGSVTTSVNAPQLTMTKTASAASFLVGVPASYTLEVTNTGNAPTSASATVTDVIPNSLTIGTLPGGCSATGQQVTCTIASGLATGSSVSFVIPVTPTAAASPSVSNMATVQGGGDPTCPVTPNCTSTVSTPVDAPQLTILKTASGSNFVVGVPASYTLEVTNTGDAATTAMATITDNIPGTLTIGTLPAGCSAAGQTVTCTVPSGLATNAPVSFVIPVTPTAAASGTTLSNTATVSGGGDPACPGAANCSSTVDTPVDTPQLQIVKTADSATFTVGVAGSYTLTVTNIGSVATTAPVSVSDNIPGTLTLGTLPAGCSAAGQVVTCTIAAGLATDTPVSFVIPVTPTAAASGTTLTNTATVSGGGDPTCPGAGTCSSTVATPVDSPQLQIVKTASSANFVVGAAASYTLQVTNVGSAATTAVTTVTDNIPGTLTIGTPPAGCSAAGQVVTCTIAAGLATNAPVSFVIPVTPTAAASGTTVTNAATVSGGGDPGCPAGANCTSTVNTPVDTPQLQIVKTADSATFTVGVAGSYTLTVTNIGSAATTTPVSVSDSLPGTLTIGTLPAGCGAAGQVVTCTIPAGLATSTPVSFVIPVTPTAAASGTTLTNSATVSGGGDPTCPGASNCTSTVTTPVDQPALQVQKTASAASFVVGTPASYTLTVTNIGSIATTAIATVTDNIPGTLAIGTLPAGCTQAGQTVTCTIATGLATGTPVSFVIPVTPTAAASGTTLTNTAGVSGGGDPSCPGATNPNCSSTVTTAVGAPALQIVKTASSPNFAVGVAASYTLTVTNIGAAATTAVTTITDNVPGSLTIGTLPGGCSAAGQAVTCTVPAGLLAGSFTSFTIPVTPTAAASGTTVSNTATVSGGGDPSCPNANNANCSSTVVNPVSTPALQVVKTASAASFTVGTPASYTLTVTNIGSVATTATASVTDNVPGSLTLGALPAQCSASGQQLTCTIPAGLAVNASVAFTIPVTPTAAASGTNVSNTATVSGGGDPTCPGATNPNCSSTVIVPVSTSTTPTPILQIVKTGPATATAGGNIVYTIMVSNVGTAAATNAILTDPAPAGLSYVSAGAPCTGGFPCSLGTLNPSQSVTIPAVTFAIAPTLTGQIVNVATVVSDQTALTSSSASTVVSAGGGEKKIPVPVDARWMLLAMIALLAGIGTRRIRAKR